jgi:hypothetical protein
MMKQGKLWERWAVCFAEVLDASGLDEVNS